MGWFEVAAITWIPGSCCAATASLSWLRSGRPVLNGSLGWPYGGYTSWVVHHSFWRASACFGGRFKASGLARRSSQRVQQKGIKGELSMACPLGMRRAAASVAWFNGA